VKRHPRVRPAGGQGGIALIALLSILGVIGLFYFVKGISASQIRTDRDATDIAALKQAKEALIGYAVNRAITTAAAPRPGDLPCPDTNNDGDKESSCGNASGTTGQSQRLGRLPWRTLGLPDLRDSAGEGLWYAVSNSFKENTRRNPLNSETPGTITLRDESGSVIFDASGSTGVVAVVIAPGAPLTGQDRSAPGVNTASNYLETALGEDNSSFTDGGTNGFIQGPVRAAGDVILNDRLLAITRDEIMAAIGVRVAREVLICLTEYGLANQERYPWAAPLNSAFAPSYADVANARFGRVPDTLFIQTPATSAAMSDHWNGACNIASTSGWWYDNNWKEMVFFAVADAYKPVLAPMPPAVCGTCLKVFPPQTVASVRVAVAVAGPPLPGQLRATNADKGNIANYLETENANGDDIFSSLPRSSTMNDSVVFR
jgi:hypothetical protein